jgi:hypothetical protein
MKTIAWEKWHDSIESLDTSGFEELETEEGYSDSSALEGIDINSLIMHPVQLPKIRTPIGFFEVDDPMRPSKMFDCWIGHTNFTINDEVFEVINTCPGVECFKVISKYRFFIGVAKLFDFRNVRESIQYSLQTNSQTISDTNSDDLLELIKIQISSSKKWAIFYTKDKQDIDYIMTDDEHDIEYDQALSHIISNKSFTVIKHDD